MAQSAWDEILEAALKVLNSRNLTRHLRPIETCHVDTPPSDHQVFDEMQPWDRRSVEVTVSPSTLNQWLLESPNPDTPSDAAPANFKLILFSGNDYLGLSAHPSVAKAASQAALLNGMGPRGSALICGYTTHHNLLESSLANLKRKQDCLLCPTGFSANMALMTALGSIPYLLNRPRIAVFSDALNHASIIDGIRLAAFDVHVYRHCDTSHLRQLLEDCDLQEKVVVSDGLFSMDGDFAPMVELVNLKRTYGFLLVIDDAHGTFVCGENGGGVPELYGCEDDVDICVGTLSKAAGCQGGFIACSEKWKLLIQSRGRAFIFSTAVPVPIAAAASTAVVVAREERWRRASLWERVRQFQRITGLQVWSPIISLVVGSEENALNASRHLIKSGFHVLAIRPPTVAPNSCRLRVTLSAAHTEQDVRNLCAALATCLNLRNTKHAKL